MANLSDNELLERLASFPKHELTNEQRINIVHSMRRQQPPKPKWKRLQQLGSWVALLAVVIAAPIIFWSSQDKDQHEVGKGSEPIETAVPAQGFTITDPENPSYSQKLTGIPEKIGLLGPDEWIAEDPRSVSKIMIHLWGIEEELVNKSLRIEGTHAATGFKQDHLANTVLGGGLYGSDANAVTSFQAFEKPGEWNLTFFVDEKRFAEFSIHVKQPYIKAGDAILMISQEDLHPGAFKDVILEVEKTNLPETLDVKLVNLDNPKQKFVYTFADRNEYLHSTTYQGDLSIPESGKWRITVLDFLETVIIVE